MLSILLVVTFDNLFIIIIPFIGYLISNLSIDYGLEISKISSVSKGLNVLFPDLILINNSFEYVYGVLFVLSIILVQLLMAIYRYLEKDITY